MLNTAFTHSIRLTDESYTSGDIFTPDIQYNDVDCDATLLVCSSAGVILSMEVNGVSKTMNSGVALTANAWYSFEFLIPRNVPVNFSANGAATLQFYLSIVERR